MDPRVLENAPKFPNGEKPELSPNPHIEVVKDNKGQEVATHPFNNSPRLKKGVGGKMIHDFGKETQVEHDLVVGHDTIVDGKVHVNSATDVVDADGNPIVSAYGGTKLYQHKIVYDGKEFYFISTKSTKYGTLAALQYEFAEHKVLSVEFSESTYGYICKCDVLCAVNGGGPKLSYYADATTTTKTTLLFESEEDFSEPNNPIAM